MFDAMPGIIAKSNSRDLEEMPRTESNELLCFRLTFSEGMSEMAMYWQPVS